MEARTIQAFLRVLYTVNNNPQYILAKSSSQVPAIICSETTTNSTTDEAVYARAPLKACLAVVCDSSPELLHNSARDFSLYVLDPLETQPLPTGLTHGPHNAPRGVAVALGLMSWAIESNDSMNVFVTGTLIPNASPALEVVFALRETKRVSKLYSFNPMSAPDLSQQLNFALPQASGMAWLPTSHFQHDQQGQRTLTRSADFPELYIGPPRRAPGRPEGSTSSKSKVKSQADTSLPDAGAVSSREVNAQSESKPKAGRRFKQRTKPRPSAPLTYSPFTRGLLTRHPVTGGPEATGIPASHLQSQPTSYATHNPLLGVLSTLSSSGNMAMNATTEQQSALLSALQELLATNPHLLQLAATNVGLSAGNGGQTAENKPMREGSNANDEQDDADSDIIILDSSTIDTTAFRRPCNRPLATSDLDTSTPSQESLVPSNQDVDSSPLPASTPPSGQEGTPSSQASTPTVMPEAETPNSKHVSSGWMDKRNITPSHGLDIPVTPTPLRTCKRKLDQYIQGQAHSLESKFPPSPSVARTSSSGRVLTVRQVQSPPMGGRVASSPPTRLPSMLACMRSVAISGSRLQASTSGSSTHRRPASLTTDKNGNQPTTIVPDPMGSKTVHSTVSSNIVTDTTSLKRRRTLGLNEFMAEQEARKSTKKRSSSGRKFETVVSTNASQAGPPHPTNLVSTLRHAQSSPPRPTFRHDLVASSLLTSTRKPGLALEAAVLNDPMATLASMPTSTVAPAKNPLKNFVLPAWARTSTAMLPRLSDGALARQQAEQEAKKAQVSLRRREAARAKRRRLRDAERPPKESSDEDEVVVANDPKPWTHPSSSITRNTSLLPPPVPSLPVFASDTMEPVPSPPPQAHRQLATPVIPSTPPRKPVSSGSARHRTPSKPGSCSLFTPSGQDLGSLFTPSTPSITRPLTRMTFTPRSPTALHRSGAKNSPRKSLPQTPWTPKRNIAGHQTPRSSRDGRNPSLVSPSSIRTPQTQTGMGTRAFLLPPPSPCTLRTPHPQNKVHSSASRGSVLPVPDDPEIVMEGSLSSKQHVKQDKEEEGPSQEPQNMLLKKDMSNPPAQSSHDHPTTDDSRGTSGLNDIASNADVSRTGEEYASSPLPPSSPLPTSPFSSPAKHKSDFDTPTVHDLVVSDSDILLPSASDSDAPQGAVDVAWLSDDACTASWFTESEASAWFTDTEAWLTDTEGGPLLTDSDGAWLSDSDAVFGNMSSLLPSSASNWLSDDADGDTGSEMRVMQAREDGFDIAAFERAFAALVEHEERSVVGRSEDDGAARDAKGVESGLLESMQPLSVRNTLDDGTSTATGGAGNSVDEAKVAQGIQELLNGLAST